MAGGLLLSMIPQVGPSSPDRWDLCRLCAPHPVVRPLSSVSWKRASSGSSPSVSDVGAGHSLDLDGRSRKPHSVQASKGGPCKPLPRWTRKLNRWLGSPKRPTVLQLSRG